jgi:DNA repair exonuclease SbcCD ATPase subunit
MKIILEYLKATNILSYESIHINLTTNTVSQLVGKNGTGKSSVAVILEEILYNNNSRGIKKGKLEHRYTGVSGWTGEVGIIIGEDSYVVVKIVGSTTKVFLTKNGVDISGHTATQTYALIKQILGDLDFKTFSKLVYQSMKSSMDFLEATDTERKKFLTSFLGLEKYSAIEAEVKAAAKEVNTELEAVKSKLTQVGDWIKVNSGLELADENLTIPRPLDVSAEIENIRATITKITEANALVKASNATIDKRKQRRAEYLAKLASLGKFRAGISPSKPETEVDLVAIAETNKLLKVAEQELQALRLEYNTHKKIVDSAVCGTCGHEADVAVHRQKALEIRDKHSAQKLVVEGLQATLAELSLVQKAHQDYNKWELQLKTYSDSLRGYDDVVESLGESLEIEPLEDTQQYTDQIHALTNKARSVDIEIAKAEKALAVAQAHNKNYYKQVASLETYTEQEKTLKTEFMQLSQTSGNMAVLLKAFSPKGLIGYKIEASIKVFEELINKYLAIFTGGQFAIVFKLDNAKLMVVVYDHGLEVEMPSLSSGETAKVNLSTLLAMRNLMSAVSKINLNVLFLDEIISVLDVDSINVLVEMLLEEHELNTFLVSHNFEHPLTRVIQIIKRKRISSIVQ